MQCISKAILSCVGQCLCFLEAGMGLFIVRECTLQKFDTNLIHLFNFKHFEAIQDCFSSSLPFLFWALLSFYCEICICSLSRVHFLSVSYLTPCLSMGTLLDQFLSMSLFITQGVHPLWDRPCKSRSIKLLDFILLKKPRLKSLPQRASASGFFFQDGKLPKGL